jgi:hypothetical protein
MTTDDPSSIAKEGSGTGKKDGRKTWTRPAIVELSVDNTAGAGGTGADFGLYS